MTSITVRKTGTGAYMGFTCIGHSGYAKKGEDIVCAAISVLIFTAVQSIETLTDETVRVVENEEEGLMDVRFAHPAGEKAALLIDSMVLGLREVKKQYGNRYLRLLFEEV